ncbi:chemotaxis protein CheB [Tabrizicola sp.]|uniref:chemotaxis protein CheB n=1 Tax=Tabrizicola sp. TaxID=2005166 RepID=UPI0035B27CA2
MARTRIILAARSPISRALIGRLLTRLPWVEVVGEAANLPEMAGMVQSLRPDLAVLGPSLVASRDFAEMQPALLAASCRWVEISGRPSPPQGSGPLRDARLLPVLTHGLGAEDAGAALKEVLAAPLLPAEVSSTLLLEPPRPAQPAADRILLLGASTGGVDALLEILSAFPADCPPTAIVQHTTRGRTDSLIQLLGKACAAQVVAPRNGMELQRGMVCIAAGGDQHLRIHAGGPVRCLLQKGPPVSGHLPSVDELFQSATAWADRVVAVILTGMGRDGARGLAALRQGGAMTIGQDEATSLVYGMPRAAWELGTVEQRLPLFQIAEAALRAAGQESLR